MGRKGILVITALLIFAATDGGAAWASGSDHVVGLRRLSEREYRNSIADIFGKDIVVQGMFEPQVRMDGLLATSAAVLSVTPVGFDSFSKMADRIAIQITGDKFRGKLVPCTPKSTKGADDSCAATFFSHYGLLLFRRPLTADELKAQVALAHNMAQSTGDFYSGLRYGLAALLQSPNFVFRYEVAVPLGNKTYTLDPYSRATRLSYLMWDTTPDPELLRAADHGELNTTEGLDKQVSRLMASPRLDTGMRAFFTDMLELDNFDQVSKDSLIYPLWSVAIASSAREETLHSTIDLALHENGDMRDLMTTHRTFINRSLAVIYGVPFTFDSDWVPYETSPDSGRSGILTQVSMLSMFSHPGQSSPTKRGVALMDIFLCEPTPTPPNNVDFSKVNDPHGLKTKRERLMAHATNPLCASCHNHSDPIGLSLEGFDSIGQRRLSENGQLIDLSATLQGKTFKDGTGLGQYLHDNPKYPSCLAHKLYAYAKGMDTQDVPTSAFSAAYKSFVGSGYRMRALIKGLVESPEFFNAPAPVAEASTDHSKLALH